MKILITGASGFIGRHLTSRLIKSGACVRIVTRYPERLPPEWRSRVDVVAGSLVDAGMIKEATKSMEVVFHLASELSNVSWMKAVNEDATGELVRAADAAGVKRFVHMSTVGVIGADCPGIATEKTPCHPKNEYERTKLAGEQVVLEFSRTTGLDAVVVRPTIVFGEDAAESRDSMLKWMRAVAKGWFVFVGQDAVANYVYVGDVVEAVMQLLERRSPGGEIFHITDAVPMHDFIGAMAEALGVASPTLKVPFWAAYATGAGMELANRLFGTPAPLTRSRVRALSVTCRYGSDKLGTQAGISLSFGYREGLFRLARWYDTVGKLTNKTRGMRR